MASINSSLDPPLPPRVDAAEHPAPRRSREDETSFLPRQIPRQRVSGAFQSLGGAALARKTVQPGGPLKAQAQPVSSRGFGGVFLGSSQEFLDVSSVCGIGWVSQQVFLIKRALFGWFGCVLHCRTYCRTCHVQCIVVICGPSLQYSPKTKNYQEWASVMASLWGIATMM